MNIRQIFGLLAAIACAGSVQAQRVGWEADFKTRFDNREFTGSSWQRVADDLSGRPVARP